MFMCLCGYFFVVGVESVPRNNSIKGSLKAKSQNKYENNSSTCKYSSTNRPAAKVNYMVKLEVVFNTQKYC